MRRCSVRLVRKTNPHRIPIGGPAARLPILSGVVNLANYITFGQARPNTTESANLDELPRHRAECYGSTVSTTFARALPALGMVVLRRRKK